MPEEWIIEQLDDNIFGKASTFFSFWLYTEILNVPREMGKAFDDFIYL